VVNTNAVVARSIERPSVPGLLLLRFRVKGPTILDGRIIAKEIAKVLI
jgi:hypothetical protein